MRARFRRLLSQTLDTQPPEEARPRPEPEPAQKSPPAAPGPEPSAPTAEAAAETRVSPGPQEAAPAPQAAPAVEDAYRQAEEHLARLQFKINRLAEDFAAGSINRDQFQKLFEHYQRERRVIENLLSTAETQADALKTVMTEGKSVVIRQQHVARAQGYAIYESESGMPIATIGRFELDSALVVPMLSSFRAATQEIFGAGIRSTAIEGGRWLCFVPGEFTTMLALFTTEPAPKQLEFIENLHQLFERANRHRLTRPPIDAGALLFPHEFLSAK